MYLNTQLNTAKYLEIDVSYVSGIYISLNDIQDRDITSRFAWGGRDHAILGLQQTAHHVKDCGSSDGLSLEKSIQIILRNSQRINDYFVNLITCEGSVGCHQEVTTRSRDQRRDDAD